MAYHTKLLILIILKESSIEWQDGLYISENNRLSGVSNLLKSLKWPWPALELRHEISGLSFFTKLCTAHDQVLYRPFSGTEEGSQFRGTK